jgi:predicted dehydrogenase
VAHISTLNFLSDYFTITYLCDVSQQALDHCKEKIAGPLKTTTNAEELCSSPNVDCVLVCNATAFHPTHAILALKHDKHVLVEKPLALCYRDIDALATAEKKSKGKVFVGYMRRYAPAFLDIIAEIGSSAKIQYVRVRDIIGPNAIFVEQSGTFPKKFSDFCKEDSDELVQKDNDMTEQALLAEFGVPVNPETRRMLAILGGLGTHDLSAMREVIGVPQSVTGASMSFPIWSAMLQYDNFSVTYESGLNNVAVFDAHIEVYTQNKIVRVNYNSPYVKGLPTTMTVREQTTGPRGEPCYQERTVRSTYEDAYTVELREWHDCITSGRTAKTSIEDAREDLDIVKMLMQSAFGKKA